MIAGRLRRRFVLVLVLLVVASVGVPAIRRSILRAAGWALVVNECNGSADIVVVSGESDLAGMLEASDLVHSGVANRVSIFTYARNSAERQFARRGIPFEDRTNRYIRELRALGLVSVEQIPVYVTGTEDEGPVLARWCDEQRFHSVVVVSTPDHTRRLRRALRRSMKGHRTKVAVCGSRHSEFNPDRWWNSHEGIRTELEELEKLLLDILRHPIS